ncbi:uncharacterized protein LOC100161026 isoform X3 [Acyrthosiphon pisum]|uniref:Uncharacterized protein n=1 Tax=Acyrthosiphon pisum TaxID=7029 RepID=A0A8R2D225_ACYPI|nr:uncharacterized protein LOC100161026 isoform X3 [Acyrthosiphon pisum]|eukprot:XP_016656061.1 PREDICTED: uncharacterized protein LOC100161026 isoform X3 [Acyrthosiphon pisum]
MHRELCSAWNSRVGSQNSNAPAHRVQALFSDLGLYLTSVQVAEMMQCVMKCANRSSPVYMTFGEFCLLARKLKNGLDRGIPRSVQFSRLLEKDQEKHIRGIKKNSRSPHSYDVFLGGSCNPTTWRQDLAIPYLQDAGVSFYNPQVDHWSQDLIEIEHAAKESATILFYVIDSQTRNVVSDIETANFAGNHNNLVLVIHPQDAIAGSVVAGEPISFREAEDIREALTTLHKIAANQGTLVFDNIPEALNNVIQILKDKNRQSNDTVEDNPTYRKIRDAFNKFNVDAPGPGKMKISHVTRAIQFLANQNLSENDVLNLTSEHQDTKDVGGNHQVYFTFNQFYAVASKFLQLPDKNNRRNGFDIGHSYRLNVGRPLYLSHESVETTRSSKTTDIYLAGESGDDIRWREDIAIPMIKKSNLTYHAASKTDLSVLLDAHTLLFVIPNNSRSLATMTLAAYSIAKSCRMVICIQNLSKDYCTVRGEKLTQTAINDYNRGRIYLADLASRERVPVFESIKEAVEIAVQKSL